MEVMQIIKNIRIVKKIEVMIAKQKQRKEEEKERIRLEEKEWLSNVSNWKYDEFYKRKNEEAQWILEIYGRDSRRYEEFLIEMRRDEREYFNFDDYGYGAFDDFKSYDIF